MSQRSDSRGSPAANSTRLALRTCSMVATRTASLSHCVLRCFGSRFASSALMPSVQTTIPFTWAMARSHVRANTESLHHTQLRPVNSSSQKLMDGEGLTGNIVPPTFASWHIYRRKQNMDDVLLSLHRPVKVTVCVFAY